MSIIFYISICTFIGSYSPLFILDMAVSVAQERPIPSVHLARAERLVQDILVVDYVPGDGDGPG